MSVDRSKTVSLRLPADLVAEFDAAAEAAGLSRTHAIEQAMRSTMSALVPGSDPLVVLCWRVEPDRRALVDEAAAALGVNRSEWLRRLVDRGLQGAGLLEREPSTPLREVVRSDARRAVRKAVEPRFKS